MWLVQNNFCSSLKFGLEESLCKCPVSDCFVQVLLWSSQLRFVQEFCWEGGGR